MFDQTLPPEVLAWKPARDELVLRHRAERVAYNEALNEHARHVGLPAEIGTEPAHAAFVNTPAHKAARRALAAQVAIERAYFQQLPRLPLATCPHCQKPLYRCFDPFGLDGLFWKPDSQPEDPTPCPHFCLLQGAVTLGDSQYAPDFDVQPGPGVPFVLPRLMVMEGMEVVISELMLAGGARAFPIAYFAPRRPPAQSLAASWSRPNLVYSTQLGVHGWRRSDEPVGNLEVEELDYELGPWLERGQLRWCEPGADRTRISAAVACPFINLPGVRQPQQLARAT